MSIPGLLRESFESMIIFDDTGEEIIHPRIKIIPAILGFSICDILEESTIFEIYVENQKVATTSDFVVAFALLFAQFYIFNMAYPTTLQCTYNFMQKYLLELKDTTSTNNKVINLMSKLKKI